MGSTLHMACIYYIVRTYCFDDISKCLKTICLYCDHQNVKYDTWQIVFISSSLTAIMLISHLNILKFQFIAWCYGIVPNRLLTHFILTQAKSVSKRQQLSYHVLCIHVTSSPHIFSVNEVF